MKPLLVYDGDCGFCRYWVDRWKCRAGAAAHVVPFQALAENATVVPHDRFANAVHLIVSKDEIYSGPEAVFRYGALGGRFSPWLTLYQKIPLFAWTCALVYGFVAAHRPLVTRLNRLAWGLTFQPPSFLGAQWLFLRGLGLVYALAFLSLAPQLTGLVGEKGILPITAYLEAARQHLGGTAVLDLPTLMWLWNSDTALVATCWAGVILSCLVMVGVATPIALAMLWILYLSLVHAGQEFLSFQWDILLLEIGFLAIFFAPLTWRPRLIQVRLPSLLLLFLFNWLLFRLMFSSGIVKLDDETWRNLTALQFHYETQPLPTRIGWYAHHLPGAFHKASVVVMFIIELALPFLIFSPRRIRHGTGIVFIAFQLLIIITGNYCFFNWLAILLTFLLFDDQFLRACVPKKWRPQRPSIPRRPSSQRPAILFHAGLACAILALSSVYMYSLFLPPSSIPAPLREAHSVVRPFYIVNGYGLFAHMTTLRPEIILQGSDDGQTWQDYEFKWKPGDLSASPRLVAPHQPRLDWQMWFAALSGAERTRWFPSLMVRLLQGETVVIELLKVNPFPEKAPKYVRALRYDYQFSSIETRRATGEWWRRNEAPSLYAPPMALR